MTAIKSFLGKVRDGLLRPPRALRAWLAGATEGPRARISSLRRRASEHPTVAIAIVGGILVGIAWVAWAIYVTANNGANAGLGVLITWPVVIGALALIAAPFVVTGMLVKRRGPDGEGNPPIAGGANGDETADG